jgi:tRNA-guanine family transglycosylase
MSKRINTHFTLKTEPANGGRLGVIHFGENGILETPVLFPTICIMTGPPGFGRNGAAYKYIKRQMCLDWKFSHFMTEILHFTEYMGTKTSLNRWLAKSFQEWMDEMMCGDGDQGHDFDYSRHEKPYEACFFLDSGGFKLLSNRDFNIDKYGYSTTPMDILELQTKMGGDIIASLDYPLAPVEYETQALHELQERSIQNGIKLLQMISNEKSDKMKPLVLLAVHGIDYESTRTYMERLLAKIDNSECKYTSFGFGIGSLVPRRAKRDLCVSIVKGMKDAINEHRNGFYSNRLVHAFGMSGDLVPTLAFLGVDTFDSNSFLQGGKNLRYVLPDFRMHSATRESRTLNEVNEKVLIHCNCRACQKYLNLLQPFKILTQLDRDKRHKLEGVDREIIKSEVYTFLSLHNLEVELREFEKIKYHISNNNLHEYVLQYAESTNTRSALMQAYGAATGTIVEREKGRKVSLELTRESFAIPETYKPSKNVEILLLLPCTRDKPYKKSRSHEAVRASLHKDSRIHIVTISGLYGLVPEEFEEEPEIMSYDYMLTGEAKDQMDFVVDRIFSFLRFHGNHYRQIFAYVTVKAYRQVAKLAFKKYGKGILLPTKPKERTSKEFLRHDNIIELQQNVALYLPNSTFSTEQLSFDWDFIEKSIK